MRSILGFAESRCRADRSHWGASKALHVVQVKGPLINGPKMAHWRHDLEMAPMNKQLRFASLEFARKKKRTKRDVFLAEMAAVVPWAVLEALLEPDYPKVGPQGRRRRPFPIAVTLRIRCLQQWYVLPDPRSEGALSRNPIDTRFLQSRAWPRSNPRHDEDLAPPAPAGSHQSVPRPQNDCVHLI